MAVLGGKVRQPLELLALVVPWLLSGCGGSSGGYADRPPSDRVAYTAWQEWTRFGRSTVVYGGQANGYVNRSGVSERSEPLASKSVKTMSRHNARVTRCAQSDAPTKVTLQ